MTPSEQVPLPVTAKTTAELARKLAQVQAAAHGRVSIIAIYYDASEKVHVAWYLPLRNMGGGLL
jgi:inorganic triphosphatase YgiF